MARKPENISFEEAASLPHVGKPLPNNVEESINIILFIDFDYCNIVVVVICNMIINVFLFSRGSMGGVGGKGWS